jgi:hypothetical protein
LSIANWRTAQVSQIVLVVVLVLDFFGRGKRADCQQGSKIENEDDDEDDWRGAYTALNTCLQRRP